MAGDTATHPSMEDTEALFEEALTVEPRFDPSLPHAAAAELLAELMNAPREGYNRDEKICGACGKEGAKRKCMRCCRRYYCDESCQKKDWAFHGRWCTKAEARRRVEEVEGHLGEGWTFESPQEKTEFAEMLLEVTGQRPDLSRALTIHLETGGLYTLVGKEDDDVCGVLSLVFSTKVKKKHLRTLQRYLPTPIAQHLKERRQKHIQNERDHDAKLAPILKDCLNIGKALKTVLPGLCLVRDLETHPTNRHLVQYVFNRLDTTEDVDKGSLIADALALTDEYLTPPCGAPPGCPMSEDHLNRYRDTLRKKVFNTWLTFANVTHFDSCDEDDQGVSDDEKVNMMKQMTFLRRCRPMHAALRAGSTDYKLWLRQPGMWLPKSLYGDSLEIR